MARYFLCKDCASKKLPAGTREIFKRSAIGPAEFQRLTLGTAKTPTQDNRFIAIDGVKILLTLAHWDCDTCNKPINSGDPCAAWSTWTEEMQPIRYWEEEYLIPS